jgi:mRNA interferase MazF
VLKLAHTAPPTAELDRDSVVNLTQLLTLDKDDLDTRVGRLPLPLVREIDEGLRQVLEL